MDRRVRVPNQLMNDIIVFPRRSCEHKELQESLPNDRLTFKPYHKLDVVKKFATTYDKDDGEKKQPRRKLYHEITGRQKEDGPGKEHPMIKSFDEYFKEKEENDLINYRFEDGKNSFLNVFGNLPLGIDKV